MIAALLFDFGGTLDGPLHWLDRFLAQYRSAGIGITREELDHAFDYATAAGYKAAKVLRRFGLEDLARFHAGNQIEFLVRQGAQAPRQQIAALGSGARHHLVEQITAGFVRTTRDGLKTGRAVLETLKPRYRMGVISNFYGNLDRIMDEAEMTKLVNSIVDSSRVEVFKPDPRIFEIALRGVRASAGETAMIGDSLDKDCAPAHRLGLKTVWYCSEGSVHPAKDRSVADFTISALGEIASLPW